MSSEKAYQTIVNLKAISKYHASDKVKVKVKANVNVKVYQAVENEKCIVKVKVNLTVLN